MSRSFLIYVYDRRDERYPKRPSTTRTFFFAIVKSVRVIISISQHAACTNSAPRSTGCLHQGTTRKEEKEIVNPAITRDIQ